MLYRTFDEIVQAAMISVRERAKAAAEKNLRKRKYNEKIRKRVKK